MAGIILNRSRQVPAEETPAFGGIAERFRRAGDLDRAIALCEDGLRRFPHQLSARVTLGWALLDKGRYAEARAELEQVLRKAPDNLAAIRGLAELHDRTELNESATWDAEARETEEALARAAAEHAASEADADALPDSAAIEAVASDYTDQEDEAVADEPAAVIETTPVDAHVYTRAHEQYQEQEEDAAETTAAAEWTEEPVAIVTAASATVEAATDGADVVVETTQVEVSELVTASDYGQVVEEATAAPAAIEAEADERPAGILTAAEQAAAEAEALAGVQPAALEQAEPDALLELVDLQSAVAEATGDAVLEAGTDAGLELLSETELAPAAAESGADALDLTDIGGVEALLDLVSTSDESQPAAVSESSDAESFAAPTVELGSPQTAEPATEPALSAGEPEPFEIDVEPAATVVVEPEAIAAPAAIELDAEAVAESPIELGAESEAVAAPTAEIVAFPTEDQVAWDGAPNAEAAEAIDLAADSADPLGDVARLFESSADEAAEEVVELRSDADDASGNEAEAFAGFEAETPVASFESAVDVQEEFASAEMAQAEDVEASVSDADAAPVELPAAESRPRWGRLKRWIGRKKPAEATEVSEFAPAEELVAPDYDDVLAVGAADEQAEAIQPFEATEAAETIETIDATEAAETIEAAETTEVAGTTDATAAAEVIEAIEPFEASESFDTTGTVETIEAVESAVAQSDDEVEQEIAEAEPEAAVVETLQVEAEQIEGAVESDAMVAAEEPEEARDSGRSWSRLKRWVRGRKTSAPELPEPVAEDFESAYPSSDAEAAEEVEPAAAAYDHEAGTREETVAAVFADAEQSDEAGVAADGYAADGYGVAAAADDAGAIEGEAGDEAAFAGDAEVAEAEFAEESNDEARPKGRWGGLRRWIGRRRPSSVPSILGNDDSDDQGNVSGAASDGQWAEGAEYDGSNAGGWGEADEVASDEQDWGQAAEPDAATDDVAAFAGTEPDQWTSVAPQYSAAGEPATAGVMTHDGRSWTPAMLEGVTCLDEDGSSQAVAVAPLSADRQRSIARLESLLEKVQRRRLQLAPGSVA